MAYVSSSRGAAEGFAGRALALVKTLRLAMQRRRIFSQTVRELNSLSVRELGDLGLSRAMIHSVAREAAFGK